LRPEKKLRRKSRRDGIIGRESQFDDTRPFDAARSETAESLISTPAAVDANNVVWFDFINSDPSIEHARTKGFTAGSCISRSRYDQSPMDNQVPVAEPWLRGSKKSPLRFKKNLRN
jgi:hypothetical protein